MCSMGMLAIAGCKNAENSANVAPKAADVEPVNVDPIDYGNNVYYFPKNKTEFANALSAFIANNPSLEVVAMASDGTGMARGQVRGHDVGYFVVFKKK